MKLWSRHSLRGRLIRQLLALQAGIILIIALGLTLLIVYGDLGGMVADPKTVEVASRAAARDKDGRLVVRETDELKAMTEKAPAYWFLLRSPTGEVLEYGPVPDFYRLLNDNIDRLDFIDIDIRDKLSPYALSGLGHTTDGPAGPLYVLSGGVPLMKVGFVLLILSSMLLSVVLVLVTLIVLFAIPWIVGRAFRQLQTVAGEAERIDIDRRGGRLAQAGVPTEVLPLVQAINAALQRLDHGYEQHRRFILDAAHELRTPISILHTRIETMPSGAMQTRLLADVGRIAALAEQLLDLQRLDRKNETFTRVDLVTLCERVAADLAPLAIASGYHLALDTDERPVFVTGSPGALERAIVNLVQNAIEHGGQSGGITIRVARSGFVEVSDDGPGIPLEEQERIFEPFYRLHPRERGAGLGLNLVREVMRHHGGYVTVLDNPHGGACFRLSLPTDSSGSRG
ncbi:two-component sensor histidine kinase [Kaistia sp. 32K]|uniref:sensor histidine kinase n=1 Tax=Kaistia sp. 32K TaxID=2795690 RepID=UPI0019151C70|nr:HAMP domain-containing sensor histidine kinase [Kaistia sp. 32K]BCP52985.1 two-component sensor histidine kinase [Kaistia sp. 32K]